MTAIYVGLGLLALTLAFAVALAQTAGRAEQSSERLLAEYLREQARIRERARIFDLSASTTREARGAAACASPAATIEARRRQDRQLAAQLSRRRTWRQPSSV